MQCLIRNENKSFKQDLRIRNYKRDLKALNMLVNHYDELNSEQKYDVINRIYDIKFSIDDYLKIVNSIFNTKFSKIVDIPTSMEETNDNTYFRYHYICVAVDNFNVVNKKYSYENIAGLTEEDDILPISYYKEQVDKCCRESSIPQYVSVLNANGLALYEKEDSFYDICPSYEYIPFVLKEIEANIYDKAKLVDLKLYAKKIESQLRDYLEDYAYRVNYLRYPVETLDKIQTLYNEARYVNKELLKK